VGTLREGFPLPFRTTFAIASLALLGAAQIGCTSSAARKAKPAAVSPPALAKVDEDSMKGSTGMIAVVEAPKIEKATHFEDAPVATDSRQMQSLKDQMTRRYGCCGR
jgi:hypothetical protein